MAIGVDFPGVLEAARNGADWAWRVLYRDLAPAVLGYLRARGAHSPEDVMGDVLCQLVRDLHTFEGDESGFRAWVFVIAHHRLLDEVRRRRRRPEFAIDTEDLIGVQAAASTEDEALRLVATAEVRELLDELKPGQRDVLILRVVGGLSLDEVATVVGKSPQAVKSLQQRGLETLRRCLGTDPSRAAAALTEACNANRSSRRTPSDSSRVELVRPSGSAA